MNVVQRTNSSNHKIWFSHCTSFYFVCAVYRAQSTLIFTACSQFSTRISWNTESNFEAHQNRTINHLFVSRTTQCSHKALNKFQFRVSAHFIIIIVNNFEIFNRKLSSLWNDYITFNGQIMKWILCILYLFGKLRENVCVCIGKFIQRLIASSNQQIHFNYNIHEYIFSFVSCVCYLHKWWCESFIIHKMLRCRSKNNKYLNVFNHEFVYYLKMRSLPHLRCEMCDADGKYYRNEIQDRARERVVDAGEWNVLHMQTTLSLNKINIIQIARWKWMPGILNENRSIQMSYESNARARFLLLLSLVCSFAWIYFITALNIVQKHVRSRVRCHFKCNENPSWCWMSIVNDIRVMFRFVWIVHTLWLSGKA